MRNIIKVFVKRRRGESLGQYYTRLNSIQYEITRAILGGIVTAVLVFGTGLFLIHQWATEEAYGAYEDYEWYYEQMEELEGGEF